MWIEVVCLCALLYGLVRGWLNGLIKELLSTGGFLIGLAIAYYYYKLVGCSIWVFVVIALVTPIVLGWMATLLTKMLDHVCAIGFLNRLAGAIVGCLKWALLVGFILLMIDKFETLKQQFFEAISG
ncbi:MAG: CvpA family protein [Bacteroidaceae bacterium]|nr:CvpA family protein [Bacteroidaceae bacterium]